MIVKLKKINGCPVVNLAVPGRLDRVCVTYLVDDRQDETVNVWMTFEDFQALPEVMWEIKEMKE